MKKFVSKIFVFAAISEIIVSCDIGTKNEFKTNENGLKYKFYVQNDDSAKVNLYDIVTVYMNYRTLDSTLFDGSNNPIPFQVEPQFEGDLMEGLLMMHSGDSATFIINADVFFVKMMKQPAVPDFVGDDNQVYFDIKIVDIKPEPDNIKASRMERESRKEMEKTDIEKYIKENNIEVEPNTSGLYYIETVEGTGAQAEAGKKVKVHYTGTFLDGEKFDASYDRGKPIEFVLGKGQVIKGWDEGIALMKEGGKATFVIPSEIAYGERGRGNIKPYTPLVFELELVEVEK